jgi:MFS superfamily sulfate permease-like transporter
MAVFAVLGSSRHLVVAADSATAAILAAAVAGLAAVGSAQYVRLAGLAALLTGAMLLAARMARLGFLANFLSRTVLAGFLTGVGLQVAAGQLPDMLGVTATGHQTVPRLVNTLRALPHAHGADVAVAAAIIVSRAADLARHGAALTGLAAANVAAAFSGTFPVNGSPTKAQIVDSAGGRSQLAALAAAAVVLVVLVLLTGPLAYLPAAALAAVVFLIAADITAMAGHGSVDDGGPLHWLVIDWTAIGDVDYTASTLLAKVVERLHEGHVRLVFSSVLGPVRHQLARYGISADAWYDTPGEALEAFHAADPQ